MPEPGDLDPGNAGRTAVTAVDQASASHYTWGDGCDGYKLVDAPGLSVIEEVVPVGAGEVRHVHRAARQFFYILEGDAMLETDEGEVAIAAGSGVEVPPGIPHRFVNAGETPVRFLVVSSPSTVGDRVNLPVADTAGRTPEPTASGTSSGESVDAAQLLRWSELNLAGHAAHLHAFVPGASVQRFGDFQVSDSGLDHDTYNTVSRVAFEDGFTAGAVAEVAAYVRSTGRPFSWWIADEAAIAEAVPALAAEGFHPAEREEAMVLRTSEVVYPTHAAEVEVRRVESRDQLAAYAAILAANWDPPAADVERFLSVAGAAVDWPLVDHHRFYLAYVDGIPAAGAEVFVDAGVAGIYGVATRRAHRGRGLATGLMASALRDLQATDVSWAVLQATPEGSSIYRRFGFRSVGACVEFALGSSIA